MLFGLEDAIGVKPPEALESLSFRSEIDFGILLCGAEVLACLCVARRQVAEPLTHRAEVYPGLQEVRGRGMPDHMWPNVLSFELRRGAFEPGARIPGVASRALVER